MWEGVQPWNTKKKKKMDETPELYPGLSTGLFIHFTFLMVNASLFGQSTGTGKALINTDLHTLAKVSVGTTGFFNT